MLEKVKTTISKFNMLKPCDRVLVGLSGGADSVSLLICLKELGYNVSAMHINHNLRGEESNRDERFCIELCERLDIPLTVKSIDVKAYCRENKLGLEEGARKLRYKAFFDVEADKICTAHTLSDSVETMLINLTRGTALKGLCGVPNKRGNIVRPLIECTREEVEEFLSNRGIDYVTDSTNNSNDYTRNKFRHLVIPEILKITSERNGSFYKNISKTFLSLNEDEDYLDSEAEKLLEKSKICENEYDYNLISSAHNAIKNRVFILLLKKYEAEVSAAKLADLKKACCEGKKINLKKNVYAQRKTGKLIFSDGKNSFEPEVYLKEISKNSLMLNSVTEKFFNKKVTISIIDDSSGISNINNEFTKKFIDYDKIKGKIFLRNRISGDKIRLINRGFTKSLKKLFNENIPLEKRHEVVVLSDEDGVIFVEGFGADERVCADSKTKCFLKIEIS